MFRFNGNKERQPVTGNVAPTQQEVATRPEMDAIDQRNAEIEAQRQAFSAKNPGFDMKAEMQNPAFINYIWGNGLSIEDAYFLTHREELLEEARNEATNALLARQTRVPENGAAKNRPAITKKNPGNLSDKEIDAIIERAKNGETITF